MLLHDAPESRGAAIWAASTVTRGRPRVLPFDLAEAIPDRTRSRINSRSNSAMVAKMPKTSRPFGVLVSTPSCELMNSMPGERNSSRALTSCVDYGRIGHSDRPQPHPAASCEAAVAEVATRREKTAAVVLGRRNVSMPPGFCSHRRRPGQASPSRKHITPAPVDPHDVHVVGRCPVYRRLAQYLGGESDQIAGQLTNRSDPRSRVGLAAAANIARCNVSKTCFLRVFACQPFFRGVNEAASGPWGTSFFSAGSRTVSESFGRFRGLAWPPDAGASPDPFRVGEVFEADRGDGPEDSESEAEH
jgi:hypothetical protein